MKDIKTIRRAVATMTNQLHNLSTVIFTFNRLRSRLTAGLTCCNCGAMPEKVKKL